MQNSIFIGLVNNAALLLGLWAIYNLVSLRTNLRGWWEKVLVGLAIGILGIAVMFSTMPFSPGVVFDTRSILLSIAGLFFGLVPALIAAAITALFRIYMGGAGVTMGVLVIFTSTSIGLAWRYLRKKQEKESNWLELYLFGIVVHVVMFLDAFTLPNDVTSQVYSNILLPVMIIYPIVTVALGALFSNQLIRKKLSLDLEKSEATYRNIVETAEEGICSYNQQGNFVFVNQKFADLTGYSLAELYERSYGDLMNPQTKEFVENKISNRKKGIRENYDIQLVRKNGSSIWVNVSANPINDTGGNYAGALAMYTDVSDRVRLQEELRKSEEYFRILYQQSPLPYQTLDVDGCFVDVNEIWLNSLGYLKAEVTGKWFGDLLTSDDKKRFKKQFPHFIKAGEIHDVEYKISRKDGESIYISLDGRIGKTEQGTFKQAYCVWRDVSQIRNAQNALIESEEKLRALANYLQTAIETDRASLAREIHDEFGQLMTGLKMELAWCMHNNLNNQLLLSRYESMNILLDDAIRISRRLSSELRPGLLDDLGLIPTMEWYIGEFMHRSNIKCRFICPENEPILDESLKTTVYRIFQEALTNIARHSQASEARVSLGFNNRALKLEIQDNGRGITSKELNNNQSFGLLGIQERARQKGGFVEISGKSGGGTTVKAHFPLTNKDVKEVAP
ncbi:MAG: PAS domain S-box protein [Anaerolineaceae bacterium]